MIEENARHAGHADILREQIDGAIGFVAESFGAQSAEFASRWQRCGAARALTVHYD
jgi:hypothetical protein